MKKMTDYIIPIKGLKEGQHEFNYTIGPSFFDALEEEDINCKTIDVEIKLIKSVHLFEFSFKINGSIVEPCDRCLDEFELEISHEAKLFLKYGDEFKELDDEVIVIPANKGIFDVSSLILEFVKLGLPIQKIHPDGECNSEMLERIAEFDPLKEEKTDPRWDGLKDLIK